MPLALAAGGAVLLLAWGPCGAAAESSPPWPGIGLAAGAEYFSWRELDASKNTLVHETGPRFSFSVSADDFDLRGRGPVYWLSGRGYVGYVDYSGQTQPNGPVQSVHASSHTRYLGGVLESGGGYRFWNAAHSFGVDLVGGLGIDQWHRVIGNTTAMRTTPPAGTIFVNGAVEDYRIPYVKSGVGLFHANAGWMQYVQGGIKWPFATHEEAHLFGVTLAPDPALSFYLQWQVARLDADGRRSWFVSGYYDSFRFNPSPSVAGVYQPESHEDVVGVQLGYYFNPFY